MIVESCLEPLTEGDLRKQVKLSVGNQCNRANYHSDERARTFCWPTVQTSRKQ